MRLRELLKIHPHCVLGSGREVGGSAAARLGSWAPPVFVRVPTKKRDFTKNAGPEARGSALLPRPTRPRATRPRAAVSAPRKSAPARAPESARARVGAPEHFVDEREQRLRLRLAACS